MPILLILFLFYDIDLYKDYERLGLRILIIGFVNDTNIIVYKRSTKENYRTLDLVYVAYT